MTKLFKDGIIKYTKNKITEIMIQLSKKYILSEIGIDKASPEPIHLQLYKSLKQTIIRHRLESGFAMPSERSLANEFDLNRNTVHRAYESLREDGFVCARPGSRGLFIADDAQVLYRRPFPTIGVILPNKFSEYVTPQFPQRFKYISGITDRAAELNFSTMMIQLPDGDIEEELLADWEEHVLKRMCGVIHLGDRGQRNDHVLERILDEDSIAQIFISGYSSRFNICSITGDSEAGAMAAAQCLYEHGHAKVGIITDYPEKEKGNRLFNYEAQTRTGVVRECLNEYRVKVADDWCIFDCRDEKILYKRLKTIFSSDDKPSAFWCGNDNIANKVIEILHSFDLKVPEDISIIGYDDMMPKEANINITSIKQPFYLIACKAVEILAEYYNKGMKLEGCEFKLPTSLVIKDSVAEFKEKHLI